MMKKGKLIVILLIYIGLTGGLFGQINNSNANLSETANKADEILKKSEKAISKGFELANLKSVELEIDTSRITELNNGQKLSSKGVINLYFSIPSQLKYNTFSDYSTNQFEKKSALNFGRYSESSNVLVNGTSLNGALGNLKEVPEAEKKEILRQSVFKYIFPLFLKADWYENIEFKYVGKSLVGDKKALLIETKDKNNSIYQFFFDEDTYLLKLMIEKVSDSKTNRIIERKFYYSDYKEEQGLLIPKSIVVQLENVMTEEQKISKIIINPEFKANVFEIK